MGDDLSPSQEALKHRKLARLFAFAALLGAIPNFEPFDPSDCKEVAVPLAFASFDGSAEHVSRDRQTEFLRAGLKHSQFSDKLLSRYHRCTFDIFRSASRRMSPIKHFSLTG